MLADLDNKLKLASSKQFKQQEQLNQIFLLYQEIHQKHHYLSQPYLPTINLFTKVRVEVLAQIYVFLDIHSLLQLRLINKTCTMQITQIIPIFIGQLEQKMKNLQVIEDEVREKVEQSYDSNQIQSNSQKICYQLNSLSYQQLHELKAISKPPLMVSSVLFYFCTLLEPTFNSDKDPWIIGKKLLMDPDCLKQFLDFDISKISQQRLIILQQIYQLDSEKVHIVSLPAFNIYKILKMITEFREQTYYIHKNHEKVIHENKVKIIKQISILQKLSERQEQ